MNKIYFKFLKYINLIDIFVLILLFLRNYSTTDYEAKIHIITIIVFLLVIINNIYHIKRIGIKRKILFILYTAGIKLFSYQLIISLLLRLDEIKDFENIIMFLFWLYLGYLFLNSYGFILEDKKEN
ncbi:MULTISPECIES: hypothetical protein [unclassified Campylobacter]|uniref:hypothetical protein n=1 Tax=unclassified Campylobacter TaxID=2593542 RepID=UPI001D49ECFD|nr:hypothetical protein [Campylobacter sp. RM12651]MBZ7978518.1 hypothetical protein [Campylobacter sp. RM12654]MBZ7990594.1 hypothetical protein [Campylobacter sp. RM9331]MBZ8004767.1 hypothetical protein [Campylobacter sp. RM9332]ULO04424.1 putative membrane protein [Campylobacter sp. RM12651]